MTSTKKSRFGVRLAAGAAVFATAVALAGCTGDTSPGGDPSGEPTQGGSATIVAAASVLNWDPTIVSIGTIPGVATDRFIAVYGVLFYVDADDQLQGSIAKSLTTDDNEVWTLTLNDGVTFSDGTPLDAEAVKYNFDYAARDDSVVKGLAASFTSEVIDEVTVELTLAEANPILDRQLTESLNFMVSPAALEEQGQDYTQPVGAGPFILEEFDQSVGETFVRNPDYFIEGKPYLDELKFAIITDPAQRVSTVVQGGADLMNNYRFALLDSLDQPGVTTTPVTSGGTRVVIMNNTDASVFSDERLRKAAALAIDPTDLAQTLTQDPDETGWTGLFPESSPFYDADYAGELNDPDAARALVAEAQADGVDTAIEINVATVPELVRSAELLQIQLNDVGFAATITQTPLGDWRGMITTEKAYDISFVPGIFDLNNAQVQFTALFEGRENLSNFTDPEMTEAMQTVRDAKSQEERIAAFSEVQRIWHEHMPFIVFGADERVFFHSENLAGLTPTGRGALLMEDLYRTDLG